MAPTVPIEFFGQKESKNCWFSQPMGKSRKYSKGGLSAGFVPDYRHAVETMAVSEGFGSSGRVDTEMTASDDSSAPKRRCISLNVEGSSYGGFAVRTQVLSLSKISRMERKVLKLKLRKELEKVRDLQKKVAAFRSISVSLSPSSDIRSCSDGLKRPAFEEGAHRSFEVIAPQGKKRAPHGRNGARTKKGASARFDPVQSNTGGSTLNAVLMKQCETLLNRLMSHQYGWVFNTPVDVVKLNIPDYFMVIKHPMDLGTVKQKIASCHYSSPLDFAADVRLTFSNAMKYNPPGNDVHFMAETLNKFFEVRWKAIEKKLPSTTAVEYIPTRSDIVAELDTSTAMPPSKRTKTMPSENNIKPGPAKRVMTDEDKLNLGAELESLLGELPESIIEFLKAQFRGAGQAEEEEIEIDIDALSDDTLFELRKLIDDYLHEKRKKQSKAEQCELELINGPVFSNSPLQPSRGNDPVDEDVDIVGGNEPPVSTYPPIEIEKDSAAVSTYPSIEIEKDSDRKNSKCSSSSSSGSDSGSSSSDSDSGSSSGSGSDSPKVSVAVNATEKNARSGENFEQKQSILGDSDGRNPDCPVNGLVQSDWFSNGDKPSAAGGKGPQEDGHQEGESAPPERKVSPDKLYRAALLRNRFADTILKAKEKTLEKGEKQDPEKLRMEREEFERRRKEEKARLEADAKAAEEAKKRAEAEAAAEARRKREQEREAARQALQQMEKTVEINESSQFMEDLEMLRIAPDEQIPSFMEETSLDKSLNCLGSFKLPGSSNPLEQLGLYMKDDDEDDEEEIHAHSDREPVAEDVEEGEIDRSLNCSGSFKLAGNSNPLEQIGLYVKEDEDEDSEEMQTQSAPEPADDREDREIYKSLNGSGSLKLPGSSNPLEQLELYMKADDEEDKEEIPGQTAPEPAAEVVEEGEMDKSVEEGETDKSVEEGETDKSVEEGEMDKSVEEGEMDKSVEEGEMDKSINGTSSLKLLPGSCKPLEQLGLYMQEDDEEDDEEEIPAQNAPEPAAEDVKGEID